MFAFYPLPPRALYYTPTWSANSIHSNIIICSWLLCSVGMISFYSVDLSLMTFPKENNDVAYEKMSGSKMYVLYGARSN